MPSRICTYSIYVSSMATSASASDQCYTGGSGQCPAESFDARPSRSFQISMSESLPLSQSTWRSWSLEAHPPGHSSVDPSSELICDTRATCLRLSSCHPEL
ncbi:uncharacterized protein K489DRAFT_262645 [Dissoconium aciculare CBS 342.82]|uniref:Uncharacterized protein n=1 Tax=Dissoconium aciculare CBS 342.82 TaxID=1314786 RepID=A0A6J3M253_9PEZI|nr:uncharacterized protein K489DRAFT_262645 [Dissoconium aciculare CBS 342.82]KAF1821002.1 hypothetical protein K489DRAFT_262645 [Dissoconium aciculare CBS 342.82]